MTLDIRQVEAFRSVALAGGFSRAARAIRVGQPSLTRSVARLEAVLGFRLFWRGQGAASLTPEGEAFLREVENTFSGLERLQVAAQDIRSFGTGRLRIACLPALSGRFIAEAMRLFMQRHPAVTVALQVRPSSTVHEWVASQRADLGIATSRAGFTALEAEPLARVTGVLIVPRGHRLASTRRAVQPMDLAEEPFLALAQNEGTRQLTEAVFRDAGIAPRIRVETGNSATLCALVAAGMGVALVNPLVAADHASLPIVVRPFQPEIAFDYQLLRARGLPVSRLAEDFVSILRDVSQGLERLARTGVTSPHNC
jgi:DNA-binding transcriptional LysR family regulator